MREGKRAAMATWETSDQLLAEGLRKRLMPVKTEVLKAEVEEEEVEVQGRRLQFSYSEEEGPPSAPPPKKASLTPRWTDGWMGELVEW